MKVKVAVLCEDEVKVGVELEAELSEKEPPKKPRTQGKAGQGVARPGDEARQGLQIAGRLATKFQRRSVIVFGLEGEVEGGWQSVEENDWKKEEISLLARAFWLMAKLPRRWLLVEGRSNSSTRKEKERGESRVVEIESA